MYPIQQNKRTIALVRHLEGHDKVARMPSYRRKVPVACLEFAGEQHGFRQAEIIKTALDSEHAFYGKVFGFKPANCHVDVEII